jgi:hypothetical protein
MRHLIGATAFITKALRRTKQGANHDTMCCSTSSLGAEYVGLLCVDICHSTECRSTKAGLGFYQV